MTNDVERMGGGTVEIGKAVETVTKLGRIRKEATEVTRRKKEM